MGALYSVVRTHPLDGSFLSCHKQDCSQPTSPLLLLFGQNPLAGYPRTKCPASEPILLHNRRCVEYKIPIQPLQIWCKICRGKVGSSKLTNAKFPSWHVILSEQKTNIKRKNLFFPCHIGVLISPATTNHPASLLFNFHSLWQTLSTGQTLSQCCPVLKTLMSDLTMTNTDHDQQPWSALSPILPWSSLPPKKLILSAISLKVANFRHFSPTSRFRPGLAHMS